MKIKHLTVLTVLAGCITWLGNSDGALPQNTGAPDDLTCGRAPCHNVPANVGEATINIDVEDGSEVYQPGGTHTLTLTISDAQSPRNGFQIVALDENDENIGAWILTAPGEMKIIDGIGLPRKYVTHQAAGNLQNSWTLDWQAPQEAMGDITFYASVLDANNNGNNMGDAVYTTSNTLSAEVSSRVESLKENSVKIYPNPARQQVYIESPDLLQGVGLYDIQGREIQHILPTNQTVAIDLSYLKAGIYFLRMYRKNGFSVEKLIVE